MAFDEVGQADTAQRKVEICERAYKLLVASGTDPHDIIFDPNIFAVATGIDEHRRYALDFIEAAKRDPPPLPRSPHLRRAVQPQLLVPRQRAGAPGDAQRLPLPRDPRRARHGDRQRRPARRLRRDRRRASRSLRGRDPRPPRRFHRAAGDARRALPRFRPRGRKSRGRMALAARRRAPVLRLGQGHRRRHRRRHRGSAPGIRPPDRGDRRAADGRHERRRRPVRVGQDVPAAGGQIGPRDEEGGRPPDPLHRGGEGEDRRHPGQGPRGHGHRQGRRPRHRQEHRRRRPAVQRLRGDRPRRDGAVAGHPPVAPTTTMPT